MGNSYMYMNYMKNNMNNNIIQMDPMIDQMNSYSINNNMINPMFDQINIMNQNVNQINMNPMNNQMNMNNPMLDQMITMYPNMNQINMNPMNNQMNMMNPMMMNFMQMNEINIQMNQNNNIMNTNNNKNNYNLNLNPKLKTLVNKIINFYHSNNNKNMNLNNQNQINSLLNNLNTNYPGLHQNDDIASYKTDPLSYIKEKKINIKFLNSDYIIFNVQIPKDITKSDFYSISNIYKVFPLSNNILIHNENILDNDDSSIEEIQEGDIIIIIEDRDYPDNSYYEYLQQKYKGTDKLNIHFELYNGILQNLALSGEATISEMIKAYNLRNGFNNRDFNFIFNGQVIKTNDETKIRKRYDQGSKIIVDQKHIVFCRIVGKVIKAKTKVNEIIIERKIGILNSIQELFTHNFFGAYIKNNEKIYIGKNIIKKGDDDISFFSLGIKNDFNFIIK